MKIVTGHKGTDHVTANDFVGFNQGILGTDNYVLNVGSKFAGEMPDSTHFSVSDGEGVMQGVHFRIEPGQVDTIDVDSGQSGENRIDLICAHYTKDGATGVEDVSLIVIKGDETSGAPVQPDYVQGNILGGDDECDFPLYKITFTGLSPVVASMFIEFPTLQSVNARIDALPTLYYEKDNFVTKTYTYTIPADGQDHSQLVQVVNAGYDNYFPLSCVWECSAYAGIYTHDIDDTNMKGTMLFVNGDRDYGLHLSLDFANRTSSPFTVKVRCVVLVF